MKKLAAKVLIAATLLVVAPAAAGTRPERTAFAS
jgi:hypothetical protein